MGSEELTAPGDYVVVYANIEGCPDFPGIIAFETVAAESKIALPRLNPVETLHQTESQIWESLAQQIARQRNDGSVPGSLRVEILRSEQEYSVLEDKIHSSFKYLATSECARSLRELSPSPIEGQPPIEDQRPLRELTWHRVAASPNNSLQRTYLPVTSFAYAKEPPASVGR